MECISISFKSAPEEIRRIFVFTLEEKKQLLEQAEQAVLLATCNRTEIYATGKESLFPVLERLLAEKSGMEETELRRIAKRFQGKKALEHLYRVTCGMDSMVLGEDEILGQVRQAYLFSCEEHRTGYELNTAFQGALACAKKIKTETDISKASVSIATLVSNEVFRTENAIMREEGAQSGREEGLRVLLIGGSGKMGSIILKNLLDRGSIHVYATKRNHSVTDRERSNLTVVDYGDRYRFLEQADVVISSTESPHYTITAGKTAELLKDGRERLFIDIAVPADIDREISALPGCRLIAIDDFRELAGRNNLRKQQAIADAGELMSEELETLYKTLAFHEAAGQLNKWKESFAGCGLDKILFFLRDNLDSDSFQAVLEAFGKAQEGRN